MSEHHLSLPRTLQIPRPAYRPPYPIGPHHYFLLGDSGVRESGATREEKHLTALPQVTWHDEQSSNGSDSTCETKEVALYQDLRQIDVEAPIDSYVESVDQRKLLRSVRKIRVSAYAKLLVLVLVLNTAASAAVLSRNHMTEQSKGDIAFALALNLFISIAIRVPTNVNLLFLSAHKLAKCSRISTRFRTSVLAQVHHYGGIHSGCAIAVGLLWYPLYIVVWFENCQWHNAEDILNATFSISVFSILMAILTTSVPKLRHTHHNLFEMVHRFGGWVAVLCLWGQIIVATIDLRPRHNQSFGKQLICQGPFWLAIATTLMVIHPWLFVRKVGCVHERFSDHAIRLRFRLPGGKTCMAVKLASWPLGQWHPFAIIPDQNSNGVVSTIISKAGDWTRQQVENPPNHIWIKALPARGVLWNATMFRKVVLVATGSGIGPCLGLFAVHTRLCVRVIWAASRVEETFGSTVVKAVYQADATAKIIDTKREGRPGENGRPKLWEMALAICRVHEADACFVICNEELTKTTIEALKRAGVNAYGPIWDS